MEPAEPLCRQQVSTSALIAALHQVFVHAALKALDIDSTSSLVVDKHVPPQLLDSLWQHAYRQTEDELLLLLPTHDAAHSLLLSALSQMPGVDSRVLAAWTVLQPFLTAMTPQNLNQRFHNGVSFAFSLNSRGDIVSTRLALAEQPLLNLDPLLHLRPEEGFRSFDVFYHMMYSQEHRAELLQLKAHPYRYELLRPSNTFSLPSWVTFADDHALAKDWAEAVSQCFGRDFRRAIMTTLSGILLLGNSSDADDVAAGAALVGLDPANARQFPPRELAAATYVALIQAVVAELNDRYLTQLDLQAAYTSPTGENENEIASVVSVVECSPAHRYEVLRTQFENDFGMNAEMAENGVSLPKQPASVSRTLKKLSQQSPPAQLSVITDFSVLVDPSVTWARSPRVTEHLDVPSLVPSNRVWTLLSVAPSPTAQAVAIQETWSSVVVSAQLRDLFVTEWAQRKAKLGDFTADYGVGEFVTWFSALLGGIGPAEIGQWAQQRGFPPTELFHGQHRVYVGERAWRNLEAARSGDFGHGNPALNINAPPSIPWDRTAAAAPLSSGMRTIDPTAPYPTGATSAQPSAGGHELPPIPHNLELEQADLESEDKPLYDDEDDEGHGEALMPFKDVEHDGQRLEVHSQSTSRKVWVWFVWLMTWWIPSSALQWIGRMRRRDVRLAWREKVVIFGLIVLFNAGIIFYMIVLGHLICPKYDKVWNHKELSQHQGTTDFYVGIHGNVYDITKFYKQQHSDNGIKTSSATMMPFAGQDLTPYFPPPLTVACPSLVSDESVQLVVNTTEAPYTEAMHSSGPVAQPSNDTALHDITWYHKVFEPAIKEYYKGQIVETPKMVNNLTNNQGKYMFFVGNTIYDVSSYMETTNRYPSSESPVFKKYNFFPQAVSKLFEQYQGEDLTSKFAALDEKTRNNAMECLNNAFVYGYKDFRHTAKCQAANVILLVIAGLLTSITLIKFLAAVRFGAKPMPSAQDRFVVCQVPVYTEDEDEVRLAIDSLTNLKYDNRRKLMVILCDGMITGSGNERPTPEIVLDVLGVPDNIDPEPKAYHAIAEGAHELNYAKVYSGLYDHDGDIVPFIVVVKVGSPSETSKPGNRGKRDSQLILMNFLNRVHYASPMCPLDLELFHHINNVIGVEPERYDYLFTVDADTRVKPDSLTRLVAACVADNSVAAVCGETNIQNEQQSLSTMVQVYEYFISHHLTKAFESMFGSVTCLPGCFSLYRLRTAQRYRPLFINSEVIHEYSLRHVDNLHKKNLFSLGEDRYLTTLMSKHFSRMKFKFVADATCETRVPSDFWVLLSQRRRWINSTVHNLAELLRLDTMCGFFLLSMRGIVFVDLIGTMMLPSVVIYLVYLIYVIASKTEPLPIISIILIGAVYGLQALVFVMHRRWQHIFWMIVYIAAYPLHSFILPVYSFWNMDNFGWGNTRIVLDESKGRRVVLQDEMDKFDPRTVPFETWSEYATRMGLPGAERAVVFDDRRGRTVREVYEDPFVLASAAAERESVHSIPMSAIPRQASPRPVSMVMEPFDAGTAAQIRSTVQQVLVSSDLDAMTPKQLRDKVADLLGVEFSGERAALVDNMIDEELENMEE